MFCQRNERLADKSEKHWSGLEQRMVREGRGISERERQKLGKDKGSHMQPYWVWCFYALMSTAGFLPVTLWNNKMLALYPRLFISCLYALLNVCEYNSSIWRCRVVFSAWQSYYSRQYRQRKQAINCCVTYFMSGIFSRCLFDFSPTFKGRKREIESK